MYKIAELILLATQKIIKKAIFLVFIIDSLFLSYAISTEYPKNKIVIATTIKSNDRVNTANIIAKEGKPGWFIELLRHSSRNCHSEVEVKFLPWARALKLLELGEVDAVFNSRYMKERAKYGVYPLKDSVIDESKASMSYSYFAYARVSEKNSDLVEKAAINEHTVVVERKASVIPLLKAKGIKMMENTNYVSMLEMVRLNRVHAAVGIDKTFDALLSKYPELGNNIIKSKVPVIETKGYVMFSKQFYRKNGALVECFWDELKSSKESLWFKQLLVSYQK